MRKVVLAICISLIGFYLSGQEVVTLSIDKIDAKTLSKGDVVSVNIHLDNSSFVLSSFQLYMKYDPDVLEYQKSKKVNGHLSDNWHDNDNNGLYAGLYIDMSRVGFKVSEKIIICEVEFVYLGGETDLLFGKENVREGDVLKNGLTKFTDLTNSNITLNLIEGCICNFE